MAFTNAEGRQQLLDAVGDAADRLGLALGHLGAAYELLDEFHADDLEERLFRPVQSAYGAAKRIHAEFATRYGLGARAFATPDADLYGHAAKTLIERAVEAVADADGYLSELQDSMLPVEVGDPETRAALAALRTTIGGLRASAREVVRTIGR